jgi:hypothetical protein
MRRTITAAWSLSSKHCLPPPMFIPDWRSFKRHHPKSSQIGVHFRSLTWIGVDFSTSASNRLRQKLPNPSIQISVVSVNQW